jgi:hypothetical protein
VTLFSASVLPGPAAIVISQSVISSVPGSAAELGVLLDRRNLPKTGNVDELIERLVEADSK